MKKLVVFLLPFLCCACVLRENVNDVPKEQIEDNYIEVVPSGASSFVESLEEESPILTEEEIIEYNGIIASRTDSIFDLNNIKSLTKEEISSYINRYSIPKLPKYNNYTEVTTSMIEDILENRNMDTIEDKKTIEKGIIIHRTNLRSFPTDIHFYDTKELENFDRIQESELLVNSPVLVLHESKDKEWLFVISYAYAGWIKEEDMAYASLEDWEFFIESSSFGVITTPALMLEDTMLDMSVKLPYVGVEKAGYQLVLPVKNKEGKVVKRNITISRDNAHIGYLPYTIRNLYIQAFKYEGMDYSWGGMDEGVDCSSYVSNVYRTFGFWFPRNTIDQNKSVGNVIDIKSYTEEEKLKLLKEKGPGLLYQPGHTMIYLGMKEGKHYMLHASGVSKKVELTELDTTSSYLKTIDKFIFISN